MPTEPIPVEIEQIADAKELVITWSDGLTTSIKDADLRRACRCADCRRSAAVLGLNEISDDVRIINIIPVGSYAVQLCFDDLHDKGIFPWIYLRQLGDKK